jgi:hypothetical protein
MYTLVSREARAVEGLSQWADLVRQSADLIVVAGAAPADVAGVAAGDAGVSAGFPGGTDAATMRDRSTGAAFVIVRIGGLRSHEWQAEGREEKDEPCNAHKKILPLEKMESRL